MNTTIINELSYFLNSSNFNPLQQSIVINIRTRPENWNNIIIPFDIYKSHLRKVKYLAKKRKMENEKKELEKKIDRISDRIDNISETLINGVTTEEKYEVVPRGVSCEYKNLIEDIKQQEKRFKELERKHHCELIDKSLLENRIIKREEKIRNSIVEEKLGKAIQEFKETMLDDLNQTKKELEKYKSTHEALSLSLGSMVDLNFSVTAEIPHRGNDYKMKWDNLQIKLQECKGKCYPIMKEVIGSQMENLIKTNGFIHTLTRVVVALNKMNNFEDHEFSII